MYEKHKELIRGEILQLTVNLDRAKAKKGVRPEEVQNIENKRRLKTDILWILEHWQDPCVYAVLWRMPPSEYNRNPDWVQFGAWHTDPKAAEAELETVKKNPRCDKAIILARTEVFEIYGGKT